VVLATLRHDPTPAPMSDLSRDVVGIAIV